MIYKRNCDFFRGTLIDASFSQNSFFTSLYEVPGGTICTNMLLLHILTNITLIPVSRKTTGPFLRLTSLRLALDKYFPLMVSSHHIFFITAVFKESVGWSPWSLIPRLISFRTQAQLIELLSNLSCICQSVVTCLSGIRSICPW